jgi:hypothetical protein
MQDIPDRLLSLLRLNRMGNRHFDLYAADIFNLGKTLLWELENAMKVSHWRFSSRCVVRFGNDCYDHKNPAVRSATVNIQLYIDLLRNMTSSDPTERPSACEAVDSLHVVTAQYL